jgi:uncharacterized membrane protein YgcG
VTTGTASVLVFGIPILFLIGGYLFIRSRIHKEEKYERGADDRARQHDEALFVSMFPELQPYYHPARVAEYVAARLAKPLPRTGALWKHPPGFAAAAAGIRFKDEGEVVRLLDAAGALLTQFVFETHPEGGVIRVGKGKLTVDTRVPGEPQVRYWHPDHEFKWMRQGWKFLTRVAEGPFDHDTSGFSDSSSSSFASRGAAVAGFAAAGGTFDGGGASQAWDRGAAVDTAGSDSAQTASAPSY